MRLIDAETLFDKVFKAYGDEIDDYQANAFMRMINDAPTIEAAPTKHGEWHGVDDDDEYTDEPCQDYECSVCGDRVHFGESTEKISVWGDFYYCPNCGATMDEKEGANTIISEHEGFTPEDFENLECVLMSAIYSCQSSIAVLKRSSSEDNYKRDQLALNEKSLQDYTALLKKIRGIAEQKGEHS